jgi:hypothetical protein
MFSQAMDEAENFVCQFPNPWALRVSGIGLLCLKMGKKPKSLHPILQCMDSGGWAPGIYENQ